MSKISKTSKKTPPSHYQRLRDKWVKRHAQAKEKLWSRHSQALGWMTDKIPAKQHLASTAIGALMLTNTLPASTSAVSAISTEPEKQIESPHPYLTKKAVFVTSISKILPKNVRPLSQEEEASMGQFLTKEYGIKVAPSLEGKRLNRTYGFIGAEQHLIRFPQDTMNGHLDKGFEGQVFYSSGMAPGRGAWGYFAGSKGQLDQKAKEREKWYIAVQTFEAPGWQKNTREYVKWFKYRKMLVVNAKTGQAVVTDVADAGPAVWTGKHLGGSPEVMYYLGLHKGSRKGAVLYFFVDDPQDQIPLGPVDINDTTQIARLPNN